MIQSYLLLLFSIFVISGCAAVSNIEELKTLQNFSNEVEDTDQYVEAYDRSFYSLVMAIENNALDHYPDKESILENFAEPIERKVIMRNGVAYEQWLYRRAVYFFESAKVYLIFDKDDHLVDHIYEPGRE